MTGQIASMSTSEERRTTVSRLFSLFNSPLGVAILTLLANGLFVLMRLQSYGGDITRFVIAGATFIPPRAAASAGVSLVTHSTGYDGQFYYLLALNPFSPTPALPGARFDLPAYRAQRILYPLLVWAFSLGGSLSLVPAMLVIVNLSAIVAVGALGAIFARRLDQAPLWGSLLAFYPGLLVSLAGDLGEPLAIACALGGLLCAQRRRWGWTALLLSLATLARETAALIPLALLAAGLLTWLIPFAKFRIPAFRLIAPDQWRVGVIGGGIPLIVALCWQFILLMRWGKLGILAAGGNNIGLPFAGLLEGFVAWNVLWPPLVQIMHYADVGYLLGLAEMTRRLFWRLQRAEGYLRLAWVFYVALMFSLTVYVWDYYWNFLRGSIEFGVLSLLLLISAPVQFRRAALATTLALWVATFLAIVPLTALRF